PGCPPPLSSCSSLPCAHDGAAIPTASAAPSKIATIRFFIENLAIEPPIPPQPWAHDDVPARSLSIGMVDRTETRASAAGYSRHPTSAHQHDGGGNPLQRRTDHQRHVVAAEGIAQQAEQSRTERIGELSDRGRKGDQHGEGARIELMRDD